VVGPGTFWNLEFDDQEKRGTLNLFSENDVLAVRPLAV
jgi:hypothetical protein